jgi:hypothetical protein
MDNSSSFAEASPGILPSIRNGILAGLDEIVAASGTPPEYRLALLTPDNDQVHVRLNFANNNRTDFVTALNALPDVDDPWGNNYPESTDECLKTAVEARPESLVSPPDYCTRPVSPLGPDPTRLQIGDFSPAFSKTRKVVVLITDAPPGGFCDPEDFLADPAYALRALSIASEAYNAGIRVNAIHIPRAESKRTWRWQAAPLMQECARITGGWYTMPQTDLDAIVQLGKPFSGPSIPRVGRRRIALCGASYPD